jgi:hypothetical protein
MTKPFQGESPMTEKQIFVDRGGRRYEGTYRVDGQVVKVTSAFGSKGGPLGGNAPTEVATAILAGILDEYYSAPRR